jgi:hypothetical protein
VFFLPHTNDPNNQSACPGEILIFQMTKIQMPIIKALWSSLPAMVVALLFPLSLDAADDNPPEGLTYQGYLVDANSDPLGSPTPRNFDVVFRIYNIEQGGDTTNVLWTEQQTVTVDNGYFSVLLGEGSAVGSEAYPAISTIFRAADASDRFIGVTVKDLNGAGVDAVIQPRLRLVTSPYSFLAKHAKEADTIVGSGGTVLTTDGPNVGIGRTSPEAMLDVDGTVRVRNTAQFDGVTSVGALSVGKTSAPTATLDVAGSAKISSGLDLAGISYFRNGFNITPNNGAGYNTSFWSDSFSSYIKNDSAARRMILGAGNRNAIWIHPNGNVGIDVDPVYKFQVNGVASATGLRAAGGHIVPSFGNTAGIKWDDNPAGGSGDYAHIHYMQDTAGVEDTSLNFVVYNDPEDDMRFWQAGAMRMQIINGTVRSHGNFYAPFIYDLNDGGYYVDPNGTSRFNHIYAAIMYDTDDGNYYADPGHISRMNGVRANWVQTLYASKTAQFSRDDLSCYIGLDQSNHNAGWRYALYNGDSNWDFVSDRRLKKDIVDAESVLDKVMNVQVRRFKFKEGSTNDEYNEIGVIAQELEDVFPDLVSTYKDPQTEVDYLAVGYTSFGVISVKAVQELKKEKDAEIQTLRSEIDELKAQINELKALIQN